MHHFIRKLDTISVLLPHINQFSSSNSWIDPIEAIKSKQPLTARTQIKSNRIKNNRTETSKSNRIGTIIDTVEPSRNNRIETIGSYSIFVTIFFILHPFGFASLGEACGLCMPYADSDNYLGAMSPYNSIDASCIRQRQVHVKEWSILHGDQLTPNRWWRRTVLLHPMPYMMSMHSFLLTMIGRTNISRCWSPAQWIEALWPPHPCLAKGRGCGDLLTYVFSILHWIRHLLHPIYVPAMCLLMNRDSCMCYLMFRSFYQFLFFNLYGTIN